MTTLASYYLYARLYSPNVLHTGKVGQSFDDGMARRPLLPDFSKRATNGVFKNKSSQDDRTTHAVSELFHSAISTLTNGSNVQATLSLSGGKSQNSSASRASNDAQYTSQTHAKIYYDAAKRQTSHETPQTDLHKFHRSPRQPAFSVCVGAGLGSTAPASCCVRGQRVAGLDPQAPTKTPQTTTASTRTAAGRRGCTGKRRAVGSIPTSFGWTPRVDYTVGPVPPVLEVLRRVREGRAERAAVQRQGVAERERVDRETPETIRRPDVGGRSRPEGRLLAESSRGDGLPHGSRRLFPARHGLHAAQVRQRGVPRLHRRRKVVQEERNVSE